MWIRPFLRTSVIVALLLGIVPAALAAPHQVTSSSQTLKSQGSRDGFVVESGEFTSVGGSLKSTNQLLHVGDDSFDRQVRGFLSFRTGDLPDNATVTKAVLTLCSDTPFGAPFDSMGYIEVWMKGGNFGTSADLELQDWQAAAQAAASRILDNAVDGCYKARFFNQAEAYINLTGNTQLRLQFELQDNDNGISEMIRFRSGDDPTKSLRPKLRVEYTVP